MILNHVDPFTMTFELIPDTRRNPRLINPFKQSGLIDSSDGWSLSYLHPLTRKQPILADGKNAVLNRALVV